MKAVSVIISHEEMRTAWAPALLVLHRLKRAGIPAFEIDGVLLVEHGVLSVSDEPGKRYIYHWRGE